MKNGNKITAAISASAVVAAIAMPVVASASTVTFTDISSSFAKDAIQKLADAGIVHGTDGKFNPNGTINKQDFTIILVNALGLDISNPPSTPTFSDVPTTSYAYKYVEAAAKAGIVHGDQGKFGYNANLERQQMALMFANAAKADVTGKASKNNFSDNTKIGSWAADAVGYAVEQGWIHGFDGKFDPTGSATRAQVAVVASAFLDTVSANKDLKIVASATSVIVGQKVTLSVPGATNVVWSVDKNGVIDANGNFVGTTSGVATVTATVNGKTLTQAISVAGAAATVKVAAVKDMVANGTSLQTITVNAVDANGNVDTTYNGSVTVANDNTAATVFATTASGNQASDFNPGAPASGIQTGTLTLTNGVGTYVIQSTEVAGDASDYTVSFTGDDNTVHTAQATVNTLQQVATSLALVSDLAQVPVNSTNPAHVTVHVYDQDGVDMVVGSYAVHVTIAGAGNFDGNSTDPIDTTVDATGATPLNVNSITGQPGNITVSATSDGLKAATLNIAAVVAQDPAKLTLTNVNADTNKDNSFAEVSSNLTLKVSTADANGYNTGFGGINSATETKVYAYKADGTVATNLTVNDVPMTKDGVAASVLNADGTFTLADLGSAADAGNYTIVVKDGNSDATKKTLSSSATFTAKEVADVASNLSVTAASSYVAAASPSTTFTAQVTDTYGNPVAVAGEHVTFTTVKGGSNKGSASINGGIFVPAPYTTVTTDATGKASITLTGQTYDGDTWTVNAASVENSYGIKIGSTPATMTVATSPATKLSISYTDDNNAGSDSKYAGSHVYAQAGDALGFTLGFKDQWNNAVTPADTVKAVVSAGVDTTALDAASVAYTNDASGNIVIQDTLTSVQNDLNMIVAGKAGNLKVTLSDVSSANVATATSSISVVAGKWTGYTLADTTGASTVTVAANTPVQMNLFASDAYGNRVAAPANAAGYHITFNDTVNTTTNVGTLGGEFRLSTNGTNIGDLSDGTAGVGLDLASGATKTIYYVNSVAGTYDLHAAGSAN